MARSRTADCLLGAGPSDSTIRVVPHTSPIVEVLLSTMHRSDLGFIDALGIQSDALVINQADRVGSQTREVGGHSIRMLTLGEEGIGLSRTTALQRARGELCLFADDDIRLHDGYPDTIRSAFQRHPDADVILFNLASSDPNRRRTRVAKRVSRLTAMAFGAPRVVIRRESARRARLSFSMEFGGGSGRGAGEDTLFLQDCLRAGLTVMEVPEEIGTILDERASTWFTGFDEQFFRDRGELFGAMGGPMGYALAFQYVTRKRHIFGEQISSRCALAAIMSGVRHYRRENRAR